MFHLVQLLGIYVWHSPIINLLQMTHFLMTSLQARHVTLCAQGRNTTVEGCRLHMTQGCRRGAPYRGVTSSSLFSNIFDSLARNTNCCLLEKKGKTLKLLKTAPTSETFHLPQFTDNLQKFLLVFFGHYIVDVSLVALLLTKEFTYFETKRHFFLPQGSLTVYESCRAVRSRTREPEQRQHRVYIVALLVIIRAAVTNFAREFPILLRDYVQRQFVPRHVQTIEFSQ